MGRLNHVACIELLPMCNKLNEFSGVSNYMVDGLCAKYFKQACIVRLKNCISDPHWDKFFRNSTLTYNIQDHASSRKQRNVELDKDIIMHFLENISSVLLIRILHGQ